MSLSDFHHSEAFLQWIWENLLFDFRALETERGANLEILNPGKLNVSDGPDFTNASFIIDGVTWYGDVEIHTKSSHWNAHGHQDDPNFNRVILHVVADNTPGRVRTKNGSSPYTLNLLPYLSRKLGVFLESFNSRENIRCASALHYISEDAFMQQIEKAHLEYFEKKADDFLQYYNPELLPSLAWKHALILSIWDGLGISQNRLAMRQTCKALLEIWDRISANNRIDTAFNIAGFNAQGSSIQWNHKSVRPANHPKKRIKEAVKITQLILDEPFGNLLSSDAITTWKSWIQESETGETPRMNILYGTVFIPSLYVLGNLFAHQSLKVKAASSWKNLNTPIPSSLYKKFDSLDLSSKTHHKKLGLVHQLKTYCEPGRCSECFVLKNAIQS